MKKGAPNKDVISATGTWRKALVNVSHQIRKIAPATAEEGTRIRWSGPMSSLIMCGITNPIKPMLPLVTTADAVTKEQRSRIIFLTFSTSVPKFSAASSPSKRAFKSLEKKNRTIVPITQVTKTMFTSCHFAAPRDPVSQKTTFKIFLEYQINYFSFVFIWN